MRTNGTLAQYAGDAKRSRAAAMRRARQEQAFQADVKRIGGNHDTALEVSQKKMRWAIRDARRYNRMAIRYNRPSWRT